MAKNFSKAVVLGVLLVFILCLPALAGTDIKASLNGESVNLGNMYSVEGTIMVPVDGLVEIMGASVERISNTQIKIVENDLSLLLTVGKKAAISGDKKIALPQAPVIIQGNNVNIPLRSVADFFGFKIKWDGKNKVISLERNETRDGLTALDILVKSNNATQNVKTYTMDGNMDIDVEVSGGDADASAGPVSMSSKITGQINNDPMQIYMKQTVTAKGDAQQVIPETVTETYMTQEKMYMKTGDAEWMILDLPFSPEFWEQQQEIQNDPLKAAAQLQEFGVGFNLGNDVTVEGKEYYVINATMDLSKAMEKYQEIIQQAVQGIVGSDTENLPQLIENILANSKLDYRYSVLINKETFISDFIKADADLQLSMDIPVEGVTQTMSINEKIIGEFKVFDFDKPFAAPDVSKAQPMEIPEITDQEQE